MRITMERLDRALAINYLLSHGESIVVGTRIHYASGTTNNWQFVTATVNGLSLTDAQRVREGSVVPPRFNRRAADRTTASVVLEEQS